MFLALSGSRLYGYHRPDSDYDYRGVFLYPQNVVLGLTIEPDTRTYTTGVGRGVIDEQLHELKKFCRLALKGNPGMLEMLFTPREYWIAQTAAWEKIYAVRHAFLSQQIIKPYSGFMLSEVKHLRQSPADDKKRRNLIRLAMQVRTICQFGDFTPVLTSTDLGILTESNTLEIAEYFIKYAIEAGEQTKLPELPDYAGVHALVQEIYYDHVTRPNTAVG